MAKLVFAVRYMDKDDFKDIAVPLLAQLGIDEGFSLEPLKGGANNRVFRVSGNGRDVLLKAYFRHPDDPRDRLQTEFLFSRFAWENGLCCLPQPFGCDQQHQIGVYEFIHGRSLHAHEVTTNAILQAFHFYRELNAHKHLSSAKMLPEASEACFTLADHIQCVENRIQRLKNVEVSSAIDQQANTFIQKDLAETWKKVSDFVYSRANALGISWFTEILPRDKRLSPSDFGFHNTILQKDGQLRFIDFEYAGWDDPAKMVCDFFCQPALPVSLRFYDLFVEKVIADLSDREMYRQRIALLSPVSQVKWVCIMLNDFLSVDNHRRQFADRVFDQEERKIRQLQKARQALQKVDID